MSIAVAHFTYLSVSLMCCVICLCKVVYHCYHNHKRTILICDSIGIMENVGLAINLMLIVGVVSKWGRKWKWTLIYKWAQWSGQSMEKWATEYSTTNSKTKASNMCHSSFCLMKIVAAYNQISEWCVCINYVYSFIYLIFISL